MIHRIGWACVTRGLGLSTNRTFRLSSLSPQRLLDAAERNIREMRAILEWMEPRGFRMLRLGQSLVPFASHPAVLGNPEFDWETPLAPLLAAIGAEYAAKDFRFSMHPGQYAVLNSPREDVRTSAQAELAYSCRVLDLMGLDPSHKVILHGGAAYGEPEASLTRMGDAILALPQHLRRRLVLENDEKTYAFDAIVQLCERTGTPPVFDIFHHRLLPCDDLPALLGRAAALWAHSPEHGRPKVHLSSQMLGARTGKHADTIEDADIMDLCSTLTFDADLMVEAKAKEDAALHVQRVLAGAHCLAGWSHEK
ncbi:UV DNA damage repair endonuclease UvsE [Desulfobaculum sp.]